MNSELESVFPTDCHLKVIAHHVDGIKERLNLALVDQGVVRGRFEKGNVSRAGNYVSYNATLFVETLEQLRSITTALKNCDGVKMVL